LLMGDMDNRVGETSESSARLGFLRP
jgi:hypothetical protein